MPDIFRHIIIIIIIIIPVFYLDWSALAAEYDLPYPVVSDNLVVDHDGDDEARLSDSVQWDGEHEGFNNNIIIIIFIFIIIIIVVFVIVIVIIIYYYNKHLY